MRDFRLLYLTTVSLCLLFVFVPGARAQSALNNMVVSPCQCPYCLPKTGQDTCYNATGSTISCSGGSVDGQDAMYADPAGSYDYGCTQGEGSWANWNADGGRFLNHSDGTITDRVTGLMWVANSTDAGRGGTYNWTNAINASENLTYATHGNWRLPNARELQSIVDYGAYNPSIDTNFFASTSNYYWSSTTDISTPNNGWAVGFGYGNILSTGKTNAYYIRPVRNNE